MAQGSLTAIERWQRHRDADALREIIGQYSGMVHAVSCRILRNRTEAEDVAQECFIALSQSSSVRADAVGAWLHAVATRQSLHRLRSRMRRDARETDFGARPPAVSSPEQDELYRFVDEAIDELPEDLRIPLVAHYLEGQSHTAIARVLGVPRRTLSHRIARGVEHVGNALRRRGIRTSAVAIGLALQQFAADAAVLARTWTVPDSFLEFDTSAESLTATPLSGALPSPPTASISRRFLGRTAVRSAAAASIALALGLVSLSMNGGQRANRSMLTRGAESPVEPKDSSTSQSSRTAATPMGGSRGGGGAIGTGDATASSPVPNDAADPEYVVPDYSGYAAQHEQDASNLRVRVRRYMPQGRPVYPAAPRVGLPEPRRSAAASQRALPVDAGASSATVGYSGPGAIPNVSNFFFTIDDRMVGETPPAR